MLTDGKSQDSVYLPSRALHRVGVNTFVVAIGRNTNRRQLTHIASSARNIYTSSFRRLNYNVRSIVRRVCKARGNVLQIVVKCKSMLRRFFFFHFQHLSYFFLRKLFNEELPCGNAELKSSFFTLELSNLGTVNSVFNTRHDIRNAEAPRYLSTSPFESIASFYLHEIIYSTVVYLLISRFFLSHREVKLVHVVFH